MQGARVPTKPIRLSDVAKAAGVSHGTASNVFSRPAIVREEVRERVMAAAHKLGYGGPDPKGPAAARRQGQRDRHRDRRAPLLLLRGSVRARRHVGHLAGLRRHRRRASRWSRRVNKEQLAWNIQSALVDGFIVFCIEGGSRLVELTRERKLPFVALDFGFDDETIAAIGVDDVEGGRMAARHLAELGHRRFAVLSLPFAESGFGPASIAARRGRGLFRHPRPAARLFRGARRIRHRYRRRCRSTRR